MHDIIALPIVHDVTPGTVESWGRYRGVKSRNRCASHSRNPIRACPAGYRGMRSFLGLTYMLICAIEISDAVVVPKARNVTTFANT